MEIEVHLSRGCSALFLSSRLDRPAASGVKNKTACCYFIFYYFFSPRLEIRMPPLPLLHVYVVIWLKMIGDVQEKVVVFICVWVAVSVMNLHVAAVCSATTLNAQCETKGTIIRVLKPCLSEKQVRKYRQGVTFLAGSLCCPL